MTPTHSSATAERSAFLGPFHDRREMLLGGILAALAGATGAAAWLYSSGWYVTFMTGNTERMVLENVKGRPHLAVTAAATIVAFLIGVIVATLARLWLWRKARHGATVLTAASTVAAWGADATIYGGHPTLAVAPVLCLAFGLGALNTSISRRGEVVMPLSYVTGTLVKIGQGAALHVAGVRRWAWVAQVTTYAGFLIGAGVGGVGFAVFGVESSLLTLAVFAVAIAFVTWWLDHPGFLVRDVH
ncbi:YoaK family protein [Tsukamurella soli]|uniref:DUF1275 domain-containing protein n=1 Tax=Tsukamurella soli TaxID=644556 RepID=A0ABP8KEA0_9ACTN